MELFAIYSQMQKPDTKAQRFIFINLFSEKWLTVLKIEDR